MFVCESRCTTCGQGHRYIHPMHAQAPRGHCSETYCDLVMVVYLVVLDLLRMVVVLNTTSDLQQNIIKTHKDPSSF